MERSCQYLVGELGEWLDGGELSASDGRVRGVEWLDGGELSVSGGRVRGVVRWRGVVSIWWESEGNG